MNKKSLILPVFAALFFSMALPVFANNLTFLNDLDIKNSGMGGANAPFSSGAFSAFINPAGLGLAERQEISLVYYNLFEEASLSAASYCLPLIEKGTLSLSGAILNSGAAEERDINNVLTGTFEDSYTAIYASYGILLYDFLSAGLSLKYLSHDFYNESTGGFGLDAGVLFILPYDLRAAVSVTNIIKPVFKYSSNESDSLPLSGSVSAGWSGTFFKDLQDMLKFAAALSFEELNENIIWNTGVQYSVYDIFFLRGGVNNEGFTAGASVKYQNAEINYALVQKPADLVHRLSVAYSFGDDIREIESKFKNKETKARYELIEKIKNETINDFEREVNGLIKAGDYENALKTIGKALVWSPRNEWFLDKELEVTELLRSGKVKSFLYDADFLIENAMYIDALVVLKDILSLDPKNEAASAKFKRTQELIRTLGESNYSVESGNKEIIQKNFESGLDYYAASRFDRAIEEWDKVIKASPLQSQVYKYIQSAQAKLKKIEQAVTLKKAAGEKKLSALYNEAVMLYTKGDFEKSISAWKEYLKLDPENQEAKNYIEKITKEYLELQKQKLEW